MTDRTYTVKGRQIVQYLTEFMAEAEMSTGDTVTIGDFTASTNMKQCFLVNQSDGSLLTSTIANNVVTMTAAGLNLRVIILAVGIKA